MKLRKLFVFALCVALSAPSFADNYKVESDAYDVMMDMVLRPVGLVATIIGAGVFVGVSPLTAMAAIPAPHDAFEKLADTIVCKPAKWTFVRPSGDYRYDEGCVSKVQPVVYQPVPPPPVVETPKPVVKPQVQYPKDTNKKIDAIFKKRMLK